MQFQISQPLLAGFGIGINNRNIRISKNNREISDIAFRNQVISTVSQIQNIYWDLVNAYEDLRVKGAFPRAGARVAAGHSEAGGYRHPGAH